jgi:hypothetical protein
LLSSTIYKTMNRWLDQDVQDILLATAQTALKIFSL